MISPVTVEIRPGSSAEDVNTLVRLHGEIYEGEFGIDQSFAEEVAVQMAELRRGGWPSEREGFWIAEADGRTVGCITLYERGDGMARLGHLLLTPDARGSGAGRRLVETVVEAAREAGYERLELGTFSELSAAIALYRSVGFERVSAERVTKWGRVLDWENYELALGDAL
jgi:N-acetylglutamate synthase-like GNAT family acetyltransferase